MLFVVAGQGAGKARYSSLGWAGLSGGSDGLSDAAELKRHGSKGAGSGVDGSEHAEAVEVIVMGFAVRALHR